MAQCVTSKLFDFYVLYMAIMHNSLTIVVKWLYMNL